LVSPDEDFGENDIIAIAIEYSGLLLRDST